MKMCFAMFSNFREGQFEVEYDDTPRIIVPKKLGNTTHIMAPEKLG